MSLCRLCTLWQTRRMNTAAPANPYKHHRIPAESISHAVWLYDRFCLSDRGIEELLCARGVTGRTKPSGRSAARDPRPGDTWHLEEVSLAINGHRQYLWWAVDQEGHALDILVQSRRNKKAAAKKLLRKRLKGLSYVPRLIITDKLKSYGAARRRTVEWCRMHNAVGLSSVGSFLTTVICWRSMTPIVFSHQFDV
jgi:putative transposase